MSSNSSSSSGSFRLVVVSACSCCLSVLLLLALQSAGLFWTPPPVVTVTSSSSSSSSSSGVSLSLPSSSSALWGLLRHRVAVFVIAPPFADSNFRHLREVLSSGPWPVHRVYCRTPLPNVLSLACAHFEAYQKALAAGLDYALVLEDDAQIIPDFWRELDLRLRALPKQFGVFWIEHGVYILVEQGTFVREKKTGFPLARAYRARELDMIGAGTAGVGLSYCAAAYFISRQGMADVVKNGMDWTMNQFNVLRTAEAFPTWVANKYGGFYSYPPLMWQCNQQTSTLREGEHVKNDHKRRLYAKDQFDWLLMRYNKTKLPWWVVRECGFVKIVEKGPPQMLTPP